MIFFYIKGNFYTKGCNSANYFLNIGSVTVEYEKNNSITTSSTR